MVCEPLADGVRASCPQQHKAPGRNKARLVPMVIEPVADGVRATGRTKARLVPMVCEPPRRTMARLVPMVCEATADGVLARSQQAEARSISRG